MTDTQIEQEIQAKGLTAPRITPADIEANIASECYFTAWHGLVGKEAVAASDETRCGDLGVSCQKGAPDALKQVTFCVLLLRNGTKIVGINYGAIDPNQHSEQRGREEARAHAIEQIWPLMGYELRSKLATQP